MGCYHPNIVIQDKFKINPKTGKNWQNTIFLNSWNKEFKGYEFYEKFNENTILNQDGRYRAVRIPCYNKCIGCIETRQKEWACRIMLELEKGEEAYMVTLTYNDTWLPVHSFMEVNGEMFYDDGTWNSYLDYDQAKKFIKDFENWQSYNFKKRGIRFYGCGEYGEEGERIYGNGRAHFHIIFIGCHIPKELLKVHSISTTGEVLYECKALEKIWDYKGFVSITEVNYQVARYVAGYVQKKEFKGNKKEQYEYFTNKEIYYAKRGQTPEKNFMSRKNTIGKDFYLENNIKFFEEGYIFINGAKQAILPANIPRIYNRWLEGENELQYEKVKERKKQAAERATRSKMVQTSLTLKEQLEVEERSKIDKMSIFRTRNKATKKGKLT